MAITFSPRGLLILLGFAALFLLALTSDGGGWFHVAEVVATVVVLLGVAGVLRDRSRVL